MQIKTKIVGCHRANSKPVKQEVNGTVILPPLEVFTQFWELESHEIANYVSLRGGAVVKEVKTVEEFKS